MEPTTTYQHLHTTTLELNTFEPGPWQNEKKPGTAAEWFSTYFPDQLPFGCPFIELREMGVDGNQRISPLAPNIDFLAACLGGDKRLGHHVIYFDPDMQFFFYDPAQKVYKPTSEEKLGNLVRALLVRCAKAMPAQVHKLNLFLEFRKDDVVRSVVKRARSILAADESFFSPESKNIRLRGVEVHERIARNFVEQLLSKDPAKILTVTQAYVHFSEYLKRKEMAPLDRRDFKQMMAELIKEEFGLGLRNDLKEQETDKQKCGWKGLAVTT